MQSSSSWMNKMQNNPYVGYGKPVQGERLVGRQKEIEHLISRLLDSTASLSIIGQRRIGKTSLITHVINQNIQNKLIPIIVYCDLSSFPNIMKLFDYILEEINEYFDRNQLEPPYNFQKQLDKVVDEDYDAYRRFRRALKALNTAHITTKLIIDEFDYVRKFTNAQQVIQWLREIIDKGYETGMSIVFLSRRSLYAIESHFADVSNLDGVCEKFYIKPLNQEGLREMVQRGHEDWEMSEEEFQLLYWYTGGYPYLSEMVLCHAWEHQSIDHSIRIIVSDLYDFYEHLREILNEDDLFQQLQKAVVGPKWDLKLDAVSKLERYGLIKKDIDSQRYLAWSEHFQLYLEKCSREQPIWSLWSETEILIRETIASVCENSLGDEWTNKLKQRNNSLPKLINDCEEKIGQELKSFGINASNQWLDYTYPNDLWSIISSEWGNGFQEILERHEQQKNKKYWNERFQLLAKIRNPIAHNREQSISESDLTLAQAYCQELLSRLRIQ
ncbi:ATP-binding protein [Deltaproteobacteria bacterium TL4]